jgi:transcriptional regulator with XRE-family HTH domain
MITMRKITKIHANKLPKRIHFIAEWLEHRGMSQADLVEHLGVNKGTVSKWCSGDLPSEENLVNIATVLNVDVPTLFRHPDDDWIARFFEGRNKEERKRMIDTLSIAFPRKDGTNG